MSTKELQFRNPALPWYRVAEQNYTGADQSSVVLQQGWGLEASRELVQWAGLCLESLRAPFAEGRFCPERHFKL